MDLCNITECHCPTSYWGPCCGLVVTLLLACRSMNWVWNASIPAWVTQVSLSGKFVLTRDEEVGGVVVSAMVWGASRTQHPRVASRRCESEPEC